MLAYEFATYQGYCADRRRNGHQVIPRNVWDGLIEQRERPPRLTADDLSAVLNGASVQWARATLRAKRVPLPGLGDTTELRIVMEGPSGWHSLSIASDLGRVNAHWLGFAGHPENAVEGTP